MTVKENNVISNVSTAELVKTTVVFSGIFVKHNLTNGVDRLHSRKCRPPRCHNDVCQCRPVCRRLSSDVIQVRLQSSSTTIIHYADIRET